MAGLATVSGQVGVGMSSVPVRIIGRRLPGLHWSGRSGIHLGVQRGSEVVGIVRGDEGEATFDIEVELTDDADFRGPYVHGRRGGRAPGRRPAPGAAAASGADRLTAGQRIGRSSIRRLHAAEASVAVRNAVSASASSSTQKPAT